MTRTGAASDRQAGFTLIELLVVMTIIGLLAAIAVPVFLNQRKKGYDASVKSDLRQTAGEMESYFVDQGRYPSQVPEYVTIRASPGNVILSHSVAGREGYCLAGYDLQGTANHIDSSMIWFDSTAGGLLPRTGSAAEAGVTTGACSYAVPNGGDRVVGSH